MKNKIKENYNHLKKNVFLVNKNIKKFKQVREEI